jgi:ribosomal-protein-alanine N-acetyltransferase
VETDVTKRPLIKKTKENQMTYKLFTPFVGMTYSEMTEVGRFLESHLDEYSDSYDNIFKSIQSAIKQRPSFGGFVIAARKNSQTVGAIIVNNTGMEGYAPQNLVVYLAVHKDYRKQGIGQQLLQQAVKTAKGDLAIHIKPGQNDLTLYQKLGFQTAALELRLDQNEQNVKASSKGSKSQNGHYQLQRTN